MPTLLVTSKMSPALAARVRTSVSGRVRGGAKAKSRLLNRRRRSALIRLGVAVGVIALVASFATTRRHRYLELEQARAQLLADLHARQAPMRGDEATFVNRVDSWLERLGGPYEGDVVDGSLRTPGAVRALLQRPSVYVRGPVDMFANPAKAAEATSMSFKDALLLCLLDPPTGRAEKALFGRVLDAYRGGANLESETPHTRLLEEAEVGLRFVLPDWEARVRGAEDRPALEELTRALRKSPTERALKAASAALLLVALDEPGAPSGPVELDGERAHQIRFHIVDLGAAKLIWRLRRPVDPSWVSQERRPMYSVGLDGCAFAYEALGELGARE
jgi:hypothetical protein